MGTLSNYATSELVDHVFKAAYSPAATLYFALCTVAPTEASTGSTITETDYAGYARTSFTGSSLFAAASSRTVSQNTLLTLQAATGVSTSDISHWAIVDAATNGNMLAFGAFTSSWNVVSGNTPKIASGEIEISIGASSGAGFTDYSVHKMLDLMFRAAAWTTPSSAIYCGLSTATLTDSSTSGTEPSGNGYAREQVPTSSMDAASSGVTTNNTAITFDTPTGSWGLVVSLIIMDAATSGNMLAYDNDNIVDQTPTTDDTVQIAAGSFDVDLD